MPSSFSIQVCRSAIVSEDAEDLGESQRTPPATSAVATRQAIDLEDAVTSEDAEDLSESQRTPPATSEVATRQVLDLDVPVTKKTKTYLRASSGRK